MLQANGMAGPVFISVGTAEKMSKFLELNPKINAQMAFVDDSSTFDAYEAVGFKKLGDSVPKNINMKAPALSGAQVPTHTHPPHLHMRDRSLNSDG